MEEIISLGKMDFEKLVIIFNIQKSWKDLEKCITDDQMIR